MANSRFFRHRLSNLLETAFIMAALLSLLLFIAWLFAGSTGILFVCFAGIPSLIIGGANAGRLVLHMYRATPLTPRLSPDLTVLVSELSRRAELSSLPDLYYIPSSVPLAFSVGLGGNGAIALSDGLLRIVSWRELVGVVAHEISHIAGNDTRVMGIADVASRLVSTISFVGQLLLILNMPLYLFGVARLPLLPIFIMMFAPLLMTLLQLALSRAREYEADLSAARLTGDPLGLASALQRMEQFQHQFLRRLFIPYGRVEVPSVLRTHPGTAKRIQRLVGLAQDMVTETVGGDDWTNDRSRQILMGVNAPTRQPRRRLSGIWY
jgi:heat shock protein HtpX